jgi:hypothetical protein
MRRLVPVVALGLVSLVAASRDSAHARSPAACAYVQTGTLATTGAGTTSSTDAGMTSASTGATKTSKRYAAAHKSVKGTVASVDASATSFVVHPKKGADVTFKVNDKTKYLPKGKSYADVTSGAEVTVTYHNDGADNWALAIRVATAPAKGTDPGCPPGTHRCNGGCCPDR